jgi:hypothetical protein
MPTLLVIRKVLNQVSSYPVLFHILYVGILFIQFSVGSKCTPIQAAAAQKTIVGLTSPEDKTRIELKENTSPCLAYNLGSDKSVLTPHMKMVTLKNLIHNKKKMNVRQ